MKVVIFCGGMGVRMGEATQLIPKPMIKVGSQPILWHIMKWYASWGHREFILCLGYQADAIREYFDPHNHALENDLMLAVRKAEPLESQMDDWRITFLDTGIQASIGDRLMATRSHVGADDIFLCTYGDGLTDAPLDSMIARLVESETTGLFMSVRPRLSYHVVDANEDGTVRSIQPMASADVRVNGGFFVFRQRIFDKLRPGEDIMDGAARLVRHGDMIAYRYDGFWAPMDTMKDKQDLDAIVEIGSRDGKIPWLTSPHDRSLA